MKKLLIISIALLSYGCGFLKDVSKNRTKESLKIDQTTNEWKRQQGDVVFLPAPRVPSKIFRDTIIKYRTEKGSEVSTSYDKEGLIDNQVVVCPDSEETKQVNLKADYDFQSKIVEKEMNTELANIIGKWLFYCSIVIGFFGAVSFIARSLILQR